MSVLVLIVPKIKLLLRKIKKVVTKKKKIGELPPTSSACNLTCHLLQPHRLPQISLFLTSAVIPVKLLPTQKQKIKLECCLQGIHLPHWHGKETHYKAPPHWLWHFFFFLMQLKVTHQRGSNSLRNILKNGWRSLLLANNPGSCIRRGSLYEKILESDAVCVYHDLVWRRNPIKMMKKPHLCTSQGRAGLGGRAFSGERAQGEGSDYCR